MRRRELTMLKYKKPEPPQAINLIGEIWKDIQCYEEKYQVSNFGRVKFKSTNALLSQRKDRYGYLKVSLEIPTIKQLTKSVHKLVATTFIPNPENKPQINHIDTIKTNNHMSNLEWVTASENMNHAFVNIEFKYPTGAKHWKTTITLKDINQMVMLRNRGMYLKDIAKQFNLSTPTICDILKGKSWLHLKRTEEGFFYE